MKHLFVFFQILSFLTGFLSIVLGLLIYDRHKDNKLKYYLLFLVSLTLILFEQIITAYETVNFIDRTTLELVLQTVSAFGCILMVYALPLLLCSLLDINITSRKKTMVYILTGMPVLALALYYFTAYKFIAMIAANSLLFLVVLISLIYSALRLKLIKDREIRLLYGKLVIITFVALPFMYADSRLRNTILMQRYFPYGMFSVAIYYFIWNVVFLTFAYNYYKRRSNSSTSVEEQQETDFFEKYKITNREKEVILLLVEGKSYAEISEALNISMPTVKTHIYNIYQKTGVNNKVALINLIK